MDVAPPPLPGQPGQQALARGQGRTSPGQRGQVRIGEMDEAHGRASAEFIVSAV
jgi:hypothetical protein